MMSIYLVTGYNFMVLESVPRYCELMAADTTIGVSDETLELLKENKEYDGQSYDELLQNTFADTDNGETGG